MARLDLGKVVGENGQDAKINGVNTLTIVEGNNIDIEQVEDTMTISFDNNGTYATASDLSTETTNRQNADTNLQSQIDAITVSSDVIDVVGTYTDLQNYDTTHVKANDIIKVLQDSTHNDAMAYYRWVITNNVGSWVYVGSEGSFYTKSEADTLLNAKEDTSNKATSISSSSTDAQYPSAKLLYDKIKYTNGTITTESVQDLGDAFGQTISEIYTELGNKANSSMVEYHNNKVTSLSSSSTDIQYPSAKCVYEALQGAGGGDNGFVNVAPHYFSSLTKDDIQSIIDNMLVNNTDIAYLKTPRSGYRTGDIVVASLSDTLSSSTTSYVLNAWKIGLNNDPKTQGIGHSKLAYSVTISWSDNIPTVTSTSNSGTMNINTIYLNGNTTSWTPSTNYSPVHKKYVDDKPKTYTGYDATKTQVLKNINGTLTWVDES